MLRFKIATSFAIAVLGAITFARLAVMAPLSAASVFPLTIAAVFVVAGLWRARIYVNALRGLAGS